MESLSWLFLLCLKAFKEGLSIIFYFSLPTLCEASDYCIIPVQVHFLASEGIPEVLELVRSVQTKFNSALKIAGILLTMYQSRPQLCRSVRESVGDVYGEEFHVFEQPIEYSIKVAECPAAGQSIFDYAPRNAAASSYRSLAKEVLRLG